MILALAACAPEPTPEKSSGDSGYAYHDTGLVPDTGDSGETGDTGAEDTGDTEDTSGPHMVALDLWPEDMIVNTGATWSLRVTGEDSTGWKGDIDGATFASDDEAIATVDAAGVVTAVGLGAVPIRARFGEVEAIATVTVSEDLHANVRVVDSTTGEPVAGAFVSLPGESPAVSDALGIAHVAVPDGAPVMLTAWFDDGWNAVTIGSTVQRQITMQITPKDAGGYDGDLHGTVDFSGVRTPADDEVVVGFAVPSMQGALASLDVVDLFAEDRTTTIYGIEVTAPANLFVMGEVEDWYATARVGPVAAWGLAGPLPTDDVTAGLSGIGDALDLLVTHANDLSWDYVPGLVAVADTMVETGLAPGPQLTENTTVTLPAHPLGFAGTESWFLMGAERRPDEGWVTTGIGLGSGDVTLNHVPAGSVDGAVESAVFAFVQIDGLGSGRGTSAVTGPWEGGAVSFPEPQSVPTIDAWDPAVRTIALSNDTDADLLFVRFEDKRHNIHDLVLPGSWSGTVPNAIDEFQRAQAGIYLVSVQTTDHSYEDWVRTGDVDPATKDATTVARNNRVP